jgi:threonine/homoserine/homoserine lactone efflux protein
MKNSSAAKFFLLNWAFAIGCLFAQSLLKHLVHFRQADLAQLFNITSGDMFLISNIARLLLLIGAFYFCLRAWRCWKSASAIAKEEREEQEPRKRQFEEEAARARAWVNSQDHEDGAQHL